MKTFKQFLYERNLENKQKKDLWKSQNRVYRVDPSNRKNPWEKFKYASGEWGSAPLRGDQKVGDKIGGLEITNVTKPLAFATPGKPNPLYAFPRKDSEGKITTAMSVTTPGKRGKILTTPEGEAQLRNSPPIKISSASSKGFKSGYFPGQGGDEVVTPDDVEDKKTTIVKSPENFVKSGFDVRSGKGGVPYTSDYLRKLQDRYARRLARNPNNTTSISYQDNG